MTACPICSGYGMRHDPIAHGAEPTWTDCRTSGVPRGWWIDVAEADEDELILTELDEDDQ